MTGFTNPFKWGTKIFRHPPISPYWPVLWSGPFKHFGPQERGVGGCLGQGLHLGAPCGSCSLQPKELQQAPSVRYKSKQHPDKRSLGSQFAHHITGFAQLQLPPSLTHFMSVCLLAFLPAFLPPSHGTSAVHAQYTHSVSTVCTKRSSGDLRQGCGGGGFRDPPTQIFGKTQGPENVPPPRGWGWRVGGRTVHAQCLHSTVRAQ